MQPVAEEWETTMKQFPQAATYQDGLAFWPYKKSLDAVLDYVVKNAPKNGRLLDIMCGPGYLLGQIAKLRPDLILVGVDIDLEYLAYGRSACPNTMFLYGDARHWKTDAPFDVTLCTGALHHVRYSEQARAIANITRTVKFGGFAVVSDCYIDDYSSELERKIGAAKLGYEYLVATILNEAPYEVIASTADILHRDVMTHEFKTSLKKRLPVLEKCFALVDTVKTWPANTTDGYGDYVHFCHQH